MSIQCCPNCGLDLAAVEKTAIGDLTVSLYGDVLWREERVPLTPAEARIVFTLAKSVGISVATAALIDINGGVDNAHSNVLHVQLSRIRAKFTAIDADFDRIETAWNIGYRWRADGAPRLPKQNHSERA